MKKMRTFSLISCIVIILHFLILSFSDVSFADEALDAQKVRIKKCISCCDNKYLTCININPDRRLCAAENENCVNMCNSQGASSSEWSDCWSRSESGQDTIKKTNPEDHTEN